MGTILLYTETLLNCTQLITIYVLRHNPVLECSEEKIRSDKDRYMLAKITLIIYRDHGQSNKYHRFVVAK